MRKLLGSIAVLSLTALGITSCGSTIRDNVERTGFESKLQPVNIDDLFHYSGYEAPVGEKNTSGSELENAFVNLKDCEIEGLSKIEEDGLYLMPQGFHGEVISESATNCVIDLKTELLEEGYNHKVMMLGDGDSIYLIYDEDETDNFISANYNKNLYFLDSSIFGLNEKQKEFNKEHGFYTIKADPGNPKTIDHTIISFKPDNRLNTWQNAPSMFSSTIDGIEEHGLPEGIFTIEPLSSRVYKVTLHVQKDSNLKIIAAQFGLVNGVPNENNEFTKDSLKEELIFGRIAIGEEIWDRYRKPFYHIVGLKPKVEDNTKNEAKNPRFSLFYL